MEVTIGDNAEIAEHLDLQGEVFLQDKDGKPLAWYKGCGTHKCEISPEFAEFLEIERK